MQKTPKPLILLGFLDLRSTKKSGRTIPIFKAQLFLKNGHFFRWTDFSTFERKNSLK
nr:MAG TPA: hypothetical protein [Caudoviricetes sp.]DAK52025.1 MAG TPA: hypothetical protein [Caudoviricetes sp.]